MKRLTLFLPALLLAVALSSPAWAAGAIPSGPVTTRDFDQVLNTDGLFIMDMRRGEDFRAGHMQDAVSIPLEELESRMHEVPHDRPVMIMCYSGKRSKTAYDMILEARPQSAETGLWYLDAQTDHTPGGTIIRPNQP